MNRGLAYPMRLCDYSQVRAAYQDDVRYSYDTVAAAYASIVTWDVLPPVQRAFLGAFIDVVKGVTAPRRVLDAGCGPGQIGAHIAKSGLTVLGIDLSLGMTAQARDTHPDLHVSVGDILALPAADATFGGVLLWYSLIHICAAERRRAVAEAARVLAPGGHLLVGWHIGDEVRRKTEGYGGLPMSLDVHYMSHSHIGELITGAGLTICSTATTEAERPGGAQQGILLARHSPT